MLYIRRDVCTVFCNNSFDEVFFNEKLIKRLIVVPSENVCVLNIMNIKNSGRLMYGLNQNCVQNDKI